MRRLASALAAGSLLSLAGCCWEYAYPAACTFPAGSGAELCQSLTEYELACWTDEDASAPLPDFGPCAGAFHGGDACEDLGFTRRCGNGLYARPGTPC